MIVWALQSGPQSALQIGTQEHVGARFSGVVRAPLRGLISWADRSRPWRRGAGGHAEGLRQISLQRPDPSGLKSALQSDSQEHAGARLSVVVGPPLSQRDFLGTKQTPGGVVGGQARGLPKKRFGELDPDGLESALQIDAQEHVEARFSAVVGPVCRGAISWSQADPGRGAGGGQARGLPNKLFGEPRPERTEIGVVD